MQRFWWLFPLYHTFANELVNLVEAINEMIAKDEKKAASTIPDQDINSALAQSEETGIIDRNNSPVTGTKGGPDNLSATDETNSATEEIASNSSNAHKSGDKEDRLVDRIRKSVFRV